MVGEFVASTCYAIYVRIYFEGQGTRVSRLALRRLRKGTLHHRPLFMPWPVRWDVGQVGALDGEIFCSPAGLT